MRKKRYEPVFKTLSWVAAAAVIIGVGVNGWFGWQAGQHTTIANIRGFDFHWGYVLGGASIVFDLAKVLLPVLIVIAISAKGRSSWHRGAVILGCLAFWIPISIYSWSSAMGGAILNRVDGASVRDHASSEEDRLRADRAALKAKNPWTADIAAYKDKPVSALEEKIQWQMKDVRWKSSDGCTSLSKDERSFCQNLAVLKEAKSTAERAEQDAKRLTEIEEKLSRIAPTSGADDPQAKVLAHTFDTSKEDAQEKWSKLFAGLLEGLGLLPALIFGARLLVDEEAPQPLKPAAKKSRSVRAATSSSVQSSPISDATVLKFERRSKRDPEPKAVVASAEPGSPKHTIDTVISGMKGEHGFPAIVEAIQKVDSAIHENTISFRLRRLPHVEKLGLQGPDRVMHYRIKEAA